MAVLTRGATGDEAVRRTLLSRLGDARRLAAFILRDPIAAEDAAQQAALVAWDRRGSLRDVDDADGWFTRIVVNVCRDELRRRARRPQLVELSLASRPTPGQNVAEPGVGTDGDLAAAIGRLTPDEQALLALRFGRDLTVPQIAAVLDVPDGTVKSRLHAALRHLRAALDAERRAMEVHR
jgi:RNA polymerase sigma-70 factor (ECF subfamily)